MRTQRIYTLYWLDGKRELVKGSDIADAVTHAGYGEGALRALDFFAKGDDFSCYVWKENRWQKEAVSYEHC
jgi:hypothetical protein